MRIIAGNYKGTQLYTPTGKTTRPTADRVRQTLFDILFHAEWGGKKLFDQTIILDAFAGTGALGLEALSRGGEKAFFCEKNQTTRQILKRNLQHCHADTNSVVYKDIFTIPTARCPCHLLFLDPPYKQNLILPTLQTLQNKQWLTNHTIIITEIANDENLTLDETYTLLTERKIGTTSLKIWKNADQIR